MASDRSAYNARMKILPLLLAVLLLAGCQSKPPPAATPKPSPPFDAHFLDMQIVSHKAGLDMSKKIQSDGQEAEVRELASAIVRDNASELKKLQAWRKEWYPSEHPLDSTAMQPKIGPLVLPAATETPDELYMKTILEHLNASVSMDEEALVRSEHEGLKNLIIEVQSRQRRQIDVARGWLNHKDGKEATP